MIKKHLEKIAEAAVKIEEENPLDTGELGFMARAMTLCTMPHSKPKEQEFTRKNGNFTLSMVSPQAIGLPYGTIPRLILAWVSSEAVRTHERVLVMGDSLSQFLHELGLSRSGGERGDITRFKDQLRRLFSCAISCNYHTKDQDAGLGFMIADDYSVWWEPHNPNQLDLWKSTLTLSERFFREITNSPIPIDMRALKALKKSPLALDIYIWLTYRTSYLDKEIFVTWDQLQNQFGSEYNLPKNFKAALKTALRKVKAVYPGANVIVDDKGLAIFPGITSVPKKAKTLSKK